MARVWATLTLMFRIWGWAGWSLLVVVCVESTALADVYNRQLQPFGEKQAFMANTGTGDASDAGAVYYNPAGLADLRHDRVSVTGSVYMNFASTSEAVTFLAGRPIPYTAAGFNTIPGTLVITRRIGDWTLAGSALVPESYQFDNRSRFSVPGYEGAFVQSFLTQDLWVGLSAAHAVGGSDSRLKVGVTAWGVKHEQSQLLSLPVLVSTQANTMISVASRVAYSTLALSATLGASYRATEDLKIGLRVQLPTWQLSGTGDVYVFNSIVSSGTVTTTTEDLSGSGLPAYYQLPLDATLGVAADLSPVLKLLADLSVQFGARFSSLPNSTQSKSFAPVPSPRLNVGMEAKWFESFPIRWGAFYNPSALHNLARVEGENGKADYLGLTAGFGYVSEHVETSLGGFAFYGFSRGIEMGTGATVGGSVVGTGFLVTTAYRF